MEFTDKLHSIEADFRWISAQHQFELQAKQQALLSNQELFRVIQELLQTNQGLSRTNKELNDQIADISASHELQCSQYEERIRTLECSMFDDDELNSTCSTRFSDGSIGLSEAQEKIRQLEEDKTRIQAELEKEMAERVRGYKEALEKAGELITARDREIEALEAECALRGSNQAHDSGKE
jgi:hypothetical protein